MRTRAARAFRAEVRLQIAQCRALVAIVHTTPGLTRMRPPASHDSARDAAYTADAIAPRNGSIAPV
ncbi:MAG TPA: hypothetical protein VHL34_09580 [Rhizomicrobium sp.]|nr:hypothetical protein [Rhizomicrobium sp.]